MTTMISASAARGTSETNVISLDEARRRLRPVSPFVALLERAEARAVRSRQLAELAATNGGTCPLAADVLATPERN